MREETSVQKSQTYKLKEKLPFLQSWFLRELSYQHSLSCYLHPRASNPSPPSPKPRAPTLHWVEMRRVCFICSAAFLPAHAPEKLLADFSRTRQRESVLTDALLPVYPGAHKSFMGSRGWVEKRNSNYFLKCLLGTQDPAARRCVTVAFLQ